MKRMTKQISAAAPAKRPQRGGTILGVIVGLLVGLAAALAVAVYVTKVPVPFVNKGSARGADQDAAETKKNKDWDPNAPLYGKNPAKPAPVVTAPTATGTLAAPVAAPAAAASAPKADKALAKVDTKAEAKPDAKPDTKPDSKPDTKTTPKADPKPSADPLGDLAKAKSAAAPAVSSAGGADPFAYFVQAGAYRSTEDAEAQRAKLSLMGMDAKITEREQSGRTVFRVRVGPFDKKDEADKTKEKLDGGGIDTALVRVQR
jgi:cell division protein FtsN